MNAKALEGKSLVELTAIYNSLTDKPIKKFSCSREAAIAKILPLLPAEPVVAEKPAKTKKMGIGAKTVELLKSGMKPTAVLEALRAEFGEGVSSMACVYWFSSKIRCGVY